MDWIKVPSVLRTYGSQSTSPQLFADIKTSKFTNARSFCASTAAWRRNTPRLKLKHRSPQEQQAEFTFEPHADSEELQFVHEYKRPVRQAGDEEEVVATMDFGHIRFDKYNQPAVGQSEPETWSQPTRQYIPRTEQNTDVKNSTSAFDEYDRVPRTPWDSTSASDTQGDYPQNRGKVQLDSRQNSSKTQKFRDGFNAQKDSEIEGTVSYSDKQNVFESKKSINRRSINTQAEGNIVEKEYFSLADESRTRGSYSSNNINSKKMNTKKESVIDKETIFEKEYFSDIMDNEFSDDKSDRAISNERDENIFEEEYFSGLKDQKDEQPFFAKSNTNRTASNVHERNIPQYRKQEIDSNLFEEQYFTPGNESAAQRMAVEYGSADEEPRIEENIFEKQYFSENSHDSALPWENKHGLQEKIISNDDETSNLQSQSYLKKNTRRAQEDYQDSNDYNMFDNQYFSTESSSKQVSVSDPSNEPYMDAFEAVLPWETSDGEKGNESAVANGKSEVVSRADRNTIILNRGLVEGASDEGALYDEADQFSPLSASAPEKHREQDIETLVQQHRKQAAAKVDLSQAGQHPALAMREAVGTKKEKARAPELEGKPLTAAELRRKLREEMRKEPWQQAKQQFTDRDQKAVDHPGAFDSKWGRIDSKGFRILKDGVMDVERMTIQDLATHIYSQCLLYEDDDLIAINKPYGLPSIVGPKVKISLDRLREPLAEKLNNCEDLFILHRLDKETTGVMLLAKNRETARRITTQFKNREIVKQYLVITKGVPDPRQGIIDIPICTKAVDGRDRMWLAPHTGEYEDMLHEVGRRMNRKALQQASPAVTNYRVLSEASQTALVLCQPESGLKHQIRVHLGYGMNTPILGDHKYSHFDVMKPQKLHPETLQRLGVRQAKVRHIPMYLHAKQLIVPDYRHGQNLYVSAHIPKLFRQTMRWLKLYLKR